MRTVEVIDYQASWPDTYVSDAQRLADALAKINPTIHHIGSTSVPDLAAKPIIDILIEVDDVAELDTQLAAFESLGYIGRGENGIPERRYFEKGGDERSHQIHAFTRGSAGAVRHLAFRDYLIAHPAIAKEYAELKKRVALSCENDINRYCDGKDAFIQKHEALALMWLTQQDSTYQAPLSFSDQLGEQ